VGLIVQKFGGSSVATPEKMRRCAQWAIDARRAGHDVVMVVSAMGDTTDDLLVLAGKVSQTPSKRELDQLVVTGEQVSCALMAMTLQAAGCDAVSLTAQQCGISGEPNHSRARITGVSDARMRREIRAGRVPVVCGFQGVTDTGETVTLGRGGSDTTAVALAAALSADVCQIFTDVDGIFTSDPRIVQGAHRIDRVTYDEMLEAASLGAKVMHPRAVELGKKYNVPIHVLHSQVEGKGTLICGDMPGSAGPATSKDPNMESRVVSCVALKNDLGRIMLRGLPSRPGVQSEIFEPIAAAGISVDDIIQDEPTEGSMNLTFTLDRGDLAEVIPIVEQAANRVRGREDQAGVQVTTGYCKVSAVGAGMRSHPGVANTMFKTLADQGIKIENISTSEIAISCILPEFEGPRALRAVHEAFGLGAGAIQRETAGSQVTVRPAASGAKA
jgi:aspartate kinase